MVPEGRKGVLAERALDLESQGPGSSPSSALPASYSLIKLCLLLSKMQTCFSLYLTKRIAS